MMPRRYAILLMPLISLAFSASQGFANECSIPVEATVGLPPGEKPVPIKIGILTIDVLSISDTDQTFHIDAFTKVTWKDPRLAAFAGCRVPPLSIWNPHLELINSSELKTRLPPVARIREGGQVDLVRRFAGEITSPHTLEEFPFDSRNLKMGIAPRGHSADEVVLEVEPHFTGRVADFSIADWEIGDYAASVDTWHLPRLGESRSRFNYQLPAQRLRGYWITKVMIPLFLIIAMSWAVFWIDVTHIPTAIGLAATSMLTLIAFQFALAGTVPRVSYLTVLDTFVFGAAVLIFLALVEAVVTSALVGAGKDHLARQLDHYGRWILPLAFLGLIIWVWLRAGGL